MAAMALRTVTCSLPIPSTSTRSSKKPAKPITSTTPSSKKVLVPIGFGTEEMEAVILVDVLRRAGADVMLASVEKELQVEGSSGTKLVADVHIGDCARHVFDLVALPGGMPGSVRLRDCEILREITTKQAEGKRFYGAICAAPAVALLPWGLLKRKQVTCHPAFMDKLPSFRAVKSNLQVSGELTTSRGPGTAFEFALSFIEQLFGDNVADEVGGQLHIKNCGGHRKEEYNQVEWSFDRIPHVLVPIANGCEETEIVMLGDILRRAKVDVTLASIEKSKEIVASQQTKIVADKSIEEASDSAYDLVILPGGVTGAERLRKSKVLKQLLKKQKEDGRMYGAICSSLAILQKQGLLTGKTTTDSISAEAGVVIDGKLITGRGLGTVTDLSLAIISKLYGHGRARSVAEGLVFEYGKS